MQAVGKDDPDGYVAYWSESHVSEDFDIALRLQIQGNVVRLASYHGDEFKEGVSLTIYDELARWEKYVPSIAHRCAAMILIYSDTHMAVMSLSSTLSLHGYGEGRSASFS